MPIGAGIMAAGGIANSFIGSSASKKASSQQVAAQQAALALQQKMYGDAVGRAEPYINTGKGAMLSLGSLYGIGEDGSFSFDNAMNPAALDAFRRSPDYQFAMQEGIRGLGFSNAAQGLLRSSEHLRSATRFAEGLATQNFGNYVGNLRGIAGMGLDATKSINSVGLGFGQMGSSTMGAIGNAQAAGTMGSANALAGGINSVTNALTSYNAYTRNNSAYTNPTGSANPWMPGGAGDPATIGNLPFYPSFEN